MDVKKAVLHGEMSREIYIELPEGDPRAAEGIWIGSLRKAMYGTRDAANNWEQEYCEFLMSLGFARGKSVPCSFHHASRDMCLVVHGDDFTILGYGGDLDWLKGEMQKTFMFQSDNPHLSFLICNSTCFFVGALGGVWSVVCGDYFGAIWNLFISYMLAYWFYFAFIVNKEKYATCSMAVLALYVGYTAFSVIGNLIFIIPPVIYGVKAVYPT